MKWGLCEYVIVHTILGGSPVILWISLGGKPKWLPLKFGHHDVICAQAPLVLTGMHLTNMHPVASENRFLCARLYCCQSHEKGFLEVWNKTNTECCAMECVNPPHPKICWKFVCEGYALTWWSPSFQSSEADEYTALDQTSARENKSTNEMWCEELQDKVSDMGREKKWDCGKLTQLRDEEGLPKRHSKNTKFSPQNENTQRNCLSFIIKIFCFGHLLKKVLISLAKITTF